MMQFSLTYCLKPGPNKDFFPVTPQNCPISVTYDLHVTNAMINS